MMGSHTVCNACVKCKKLILNGSKAGGLLPRKSTTGHLIPSPSFVPTLVHTAKHTLPPPPTSPPPDNSPCPYGWRCCHPHDNCCAPLSLHTPLPHCCCGWQRGSNRQTEAPRRSTRAAAVDSQHCQCVCAAAPEVWRRPSGLHPQHCQLAICLSPFERRHF